MKVFLIPFDSSVAVDKIWVAAKTCYSAKTPIELWEEASSIPLDKKTAFIDNKIKAGHLSVVEHLHLTFLIAGVSRALTHQLVRHRLCNYSQQSQRYVNLNKMDKSAEDYFVIPPSIQKNEEALVTYKSAMLEASTAYNRLVSLGILPEDARFDIGNGCKTNIVMTVNLRELMHICNERLCTAAQWEIRQLVSEMKRCVVSVLPFMEKWLQPKCKILGYCPESAKRSCGMTPTRDNL